MDGIIGGRAFIRDVWGNPFAGTRREQSITNEEHIVENIPLASPAWYGIPLREVPKRGTVSISGYTEVYTEPAAGQFWVDYEPDETDADRQGTAYIKFHSSEEGNKVEVSYTGMGSPVRAAIINEHQMFQSLFDIFGGNGLDGDYTPASSEAWTATPKQYRNLTINSGVTITPDTGVERLIIGVTERLTIKGTIDVSSVVQRSSTAYPDMCNAGTVQKWQYLPDDFLHKFLAIRLGVGAIATGAEGGAYGGGNLVIECNELDFQSGAYLKANGEDSAGGHGGQDGGDAGNIFVFYRTLIDDSGTFECNGGVHTFTGSDGIDGIYKLIQIREDAISV